MIATRYWAKDKPEHQHSSEVKILQGLSNNKAEVMKIMWQSQVAKTAFEKARKFSKQETLETIYDYTSNIAMAELSIQAK